MKNARLAFVILCFCSCATTCGGCFLVDGAGVNAEQTIAHEFYPSALLAKYEWFKDAAAQLDKKKADIQVFEARKDSLKKEYGKKSRDQWAREDREQFNLWETEVAGIQASYNSLAAEYNAQMSKFNWRFANAGDVPPGGQPLPREYRTYEGAKQ